MYTLRKLKPDSNFTYILMPIGIIAIGIILSVTIGLNVMFYFWTVVIILYGLYTFLIFVRTQNTGYIVTTLYLFAAGLMTYTTPLSIQNRSRPISLIFAGPMIFFGAWMLILALNKKLKWRGREVLELAAQSVEDTGNGYTPRPLPAGRTDFKRDQILAFTNFCLKNLIAIPYIGKDKIIFVPILMGREFAFVLGLKSDVMNETWVTFDYDGSVTVNISQHDYLEYKEAFSFEQLCSSLGELFVEFMNMYQRGEGVRIIDRLNAVGITFS